MLCEKVLTMSIALSGWFNDVSSNAGDTGMGKAVPTMAKCLILFGFLLESRAAASRTMSEPKLCPTKAADLMSAASKSARTKSAADSTDKQGGTSRLMPALLPCPGKSTAKMLKPWFAR